MAERWLMGLACTIVGAGVAFWGLRGLWRGLQSMRWPRIQGVVKRVSINMDNIVDVSYEYTVDGRRFLSDRVRFGGPRDFASARGATAYADRYQIGGKILVRYDPQSPDQSVLEPGLAFGPLVACIVGVPMLLVGVALLFRFDM